MVVVLFRSRLRSDAGPDYAAMADRMEELARQQPGFVSFVAFESPNGERVALIEFETMEHVLAWRNHPEHKEAQLAGRERFYSEFRVTVAEAVRDYSFAR